MADPEIIKIKVDTSEFERSMNDLDSRLNKTESAASSAGKRMGDSLNQGAQGAERAADNLGRMGATAAQANQRLQEIERTIREQNQITIEFRQELIRLERQYKQVGGSGTKAGKEIKAQMDQLKNSIKDQTQSLRQLNAERSKQKQHVAELGKTRGAVGKLTGAFGRLVPVIGAAMAVERVARFAFEAAKLAQTAESVEKAFNNIDGSSLSALREATRGTVSDLELMKSAVSASNLGVPIENLGTFFAFASQRAAETGQSVDYLVESIVSGVGRKSPLILDNLGISASRLKDELGGVGIQSASTAEVAAALSRIIEEEMGPGIETAVNASQRFSASWQNFSLEFGKAIKPALDGLQEGVAGVVDDVTNFMRQDVGFWTRVGQATRALSPAYVGVRGEITATVMAQEFAAQATKEAEQAKRKEIRETQELIREELLLRGIIRKEIEKPVPRPLLQGLEDAISALDEQIKSATDLDVILALNANKVQLSLERQRILNQLKAEQEAAERRINEQLELREKLENWDAVEAGERKLAIELDEEAMDEALDDSLKFFKNAADRMEYINEKSEDAMAKKRVEARANAAFEAAEKEEEVARASDQRQRESAQARAEWEIQVEQEKVMAIAGLAGALTSLLAATGNERAAITKALASFEVMLNAYAAIQSTLAETPGGPVAKSIAAAAIGVQAFANLARINALQPPSFYEGTEYVKRGKAPKGRDTIPAMLDEGEAVIRAKRNAEFPGLAKAWNEGTLDAWIDTKYVLPAIREHLGKMEVMKENRRAAKVADAMFFNYDDDRVVGELRKTRKVSEAYLEELRRGRRRRNVYRA